MRLRRSNLALALTLAACSAPPPPAPPPAVAIAPASAAPAPPPQPSAAPTAEEAAPPDRAAACEREANEVFSEDHPTLESCNEMAMKLHEIAARCDEDMQQKVHLRRGAYARCVAAVEETELDKRIQALGADRAAVDREKKVQSAFDAEVTRACACHDGPSHGEAECEAAFHAQRTGWLVQARGGTLEISADRGKDAVSQRKAARKARAKELAPFAPFAKALCASPKASWKGGKAPAACTEEVMGELAAILTQVDLRAGECPRR